MPRKFKTKKNQRTSYIYYPAEGPQIILTPGEDDVTETDITLLHAMDDSEYDKDRRNDYRTTYFSSYFIGEDDDADDRNRYLIDHDSYINKIIEKKCEEKNHRLNLETLKKSMQSLLPQQRELIYKIYFEGRSNTDIAAEEGITEAAVRNRLKKIYAKILKSFEKGGSNVFDFSLIDRGNKKNLTSKRR